MFDADAERAVLGAMMLHPDVAIEIYDIVGDTDFYQPNHAAVFRAVTAAMLDAEPHDPIAVAARLTTSGWLDRVGGAPALHGLVASVGIPASATWYARRIRELATRRTIAAAAVKAHQRACNPETELAAIVDAIQADMHAATQGRATRREPVAFGDGLAATLDEICDPRGPDRGLSTGLGALDDIIGGLKPGQLVVVGGRPGAGKSVLAVDMLRATAVKRGLPALIISLEMSIDEIRKRVMAAECKVNLGRILNGGLRGDEIARLRLNAPRLGQTPVYIDDSSSADLASIRAAARRHQQRHGLHLLVVDYLQLMTSTVTSESRTQEVAAISRGLKVLARELSVPVVAAAQLNRSSETRADRRPQLSDLRESGSIEADADIVILLHRPDYHDPEHKRAGEIDLIICKNRNGPMETVTAAAQLEFARIVDLLPEYQ